MQQTNAENTRRVVAKERIETLCGILNRSASEARNMHEFDWLVTDRAEDVLPPTYRQALTKPFIGAMWANYQKHGYCTKAEDLREMERALSEDDSD